MIDHQLLLVDSLYNTESFRESSELCSTRAVENVSMVNSHGYSQWEQLYPFRDHYTILYDVVAELSHQQSLRFVYTGIVLYYCCCTFGGSSYCRVVVVAVGVGGDASKSMLVGVPSDAGSD